MLSVGSVLVFADSYLLYTLPAQKCVPSGISFETLRYFYSLDMFVGSVNVSLPDMYVCIPIYK